MKKIALLLKVIKNDLRVLWYALRHPDRPAWLMPAIALVALYAIDPFNVAVPFVGLTLRRLNVPPGVCTTSFISAPKTALEIIVEIS